MKIYEYRKDSWTQHLDDTAIITRSKFISSVSSYHGGTTEYINRVTLNAFGKSLQLAFWISKEVTGDYK